VKPKANESDAEAMVERVSKRAQELVCSVAKNLHEVSKSSSAATTAGVVFFPYGIQLIHLKITVGPDATPLVALDLEISGLKGDKGAQSINAADTANDH
jgi:hypothetical protein